VSHFKWDPPTGNQVGRSFLVALAPFLDGVVSRVKTRGAKGLAALQKLVNSLTIVLCIHASFAHLNV
jgi:hypothetical protein